MEQGLLQYEDLKEFKFEDWDGKPFLAFHTDFTIDFVTITPEGELARPARRVIGYSTFNGQQLWKLDTNVHWRHVYKFEDNEHFFHKRLTYRQLSRWLACGKGEVRFGTNLNISTRVVYNESSANIEVPSDYTIRTWDSEEWVQPTTKVLDELK